MKMDQRIFDQLDRLERGARVETRPSRYAYADSSGEYSAYDGHPTGYDNVDGYPDDTRYDISVYNVHDGARRQFGKPNPSDLWAPI